jgi:hypothetical protein
MFQFVKEVARTFLNLPTGGRIFRDWPSDSLEKYTLARQQRQQALLAFYCEDCLSSELLLRQARFLEPDMRNYARMVFLSDRQPGASELAGKLGVTKWPALLLVSRDGVPLRRWGTLSNPSEIVIEIEKLHREAALKEAKAAPPA